MTEVGCLTDVACSIAAGGTDLYDIEALRAQGGRNAMIRASKITGALHRVRGA